MVDARGWATASTTLLSLKSMCGGGVPSSHPSLAPWAVRSLFRYVFNDVEQCLTTALFTARADGSSASPARQDFCKACLWQVTDASIDFKKMKEIDLRDPNSN